MELINTVSEKEYKAKINDNDLMFKATEANGIVREVEFKMFKGDYTKQYIILAGKVYGDSTNVDLTSSEWFEGIEGIVKQIIELAKGIIKNN